jgi:hypothetical protein
MGGFILTAGTKLLAAHHNDEFDSYIEFYRGPNVIGFFDRGPAPKEPLSNIWDDIIQQVVHDNTTDPQNIFEGHTDRNDGLCLLPNLNKKAHKNLLNRWRIYFKKFIFPKTQQEQLIAEIFNALQDHTIKYIVFDVAETAAYGIASARHTDSAGSDYQQITLQTVELPVDPGYGPNYVRDFRPV